MAEKTIIYSAYNRPKTIPHPRCTKVVMEHSLHIDEKTGIEYLVKDNPKNVYDYIQEGREETLVNNIIRRAKEGDPNALAAVKGQFIDITNAPASLLDALVTIRDAENKFSNLPLDIKNQFNNDVNQFVAKAGSKEWMDIMGYTPKPTYPEPKPMSGAEPEPAKGGEE